MGTCNLNPVYTGEPKLSEDVPGYTLMEGEGRVCVCGWGGGRGEGQFTGAEYVKV